MSRREREDRDSQSKRLRSRFDREPSPKKSRRDGHHATERHHLDIETHKDGDRANRRKFQDALPLEISPSTETKKQAKTLKEVSEKKVDAQTEIPRSRSFFQHDERRHGGQSFTSRSTGHGRSNPNQQPSDRHREKIDEKKPWTHDRYFELKNVTPPPRKRRMFRESKTEAPSHTAEPAKLISERRDERGYYPRENKPDRPIPRADDRNFRRGGYESRDRFGGAGHRGRDGFDSRRNINNNFGGFQVDKWKHDLYDEANKSPTSKNEEEEIAKVEALLAS